MIQFTETVWSDILAQSTAAGRATALAGKNPDTLELLDASDAVIRTITVGAWSVGAPQGGYYPAVPGSFTDSALGSGTPVAAVLKAAGVEVARMSCGTGAGNFYRLVANVVANVPIRRGPFQIFFAPPSASAVPTMVVAPSISPSVVYPGDTLVGSRGTWTGSPTSWAFQWLADGVEISGATAETFEVPSNYGGKRITYRVIPSNNAGAATPATSSHRDVFGFMNMPASISILKPGSYDLGALVVGGVPPYSGYAIDSGSWPGVSINETTGLLTVSEAAANGTTGALTVGVDDSAVAASLPTFGATAGVSGELPWTFAHVFRQGDVKASEYVTVEGASAYQVEVRNTWADGSVAFAVISALATFTEAVRKDFQLGVTTTAPSGSNVASVAAGDIVGTTNVVHSAAGTVALVDAINGADLSNFSGTPGIRPASAGKLRSIPGTVMTEEHFYSPFPSDGHLCVFWYVRKYADGRICIESSMEQGWTRVASPVEIGGTVTVTIGGVELFSGTVAHRHHARFSKTGWIGGDPEIVPHHDGAYMRASTLVPNMSSGAPLGATLDALVQSVGPMERGPFDQAAAGGGYHGHLGIIPEWDAMYVTSNGDARAYRAVLAAEQASQCGMIQQAGAVQRDEATLRPGVITSYYNDSLSDAYSPDYGAGMVYRGSNPSESVWNTDIAHSWAAGYMAYLITGRWFSLETIQMVALAEFLSWGTRPAFSEARGMVSEDRAAAWTTRQLACALAMTPATIADQAGIKAGFKAHLEASWNEWATNEITSNTLGIRRRIYNKSGYEASGPSATHLTFGAFQHYFIIQCFFFGYQIAAHLVSAAASNQWLESAMFHGKLAAGLAGTTDYCYRHAAQYGLTAGPDYDTPDVFYGSFAQMYDENAAQGRFTADNTCAVSSALEGGNFPDATSYWGNYLPALAYAAEFNVSGAQDGWARITGASNWATLNAGFADNAPHFGVSPR